MESDIKYRHVWIFMSRWIGYITPTVYTSCFNTMSYTRERFPVVYSSALQRVTGNHYFPPFSRYLTASVIRLFFSLTMMIANWQQNPQLSFSTTLFLSLPFLLCLSIYLSILSYYLSLVHIRTRVQEVLPVKTHFFVTFSQRNKTCLLGHWVWN